MRTFNPSRLNARLALRAVAWRLRRDPLLRLLGVEWQRQKIDANGLARGPMTLTTGARAFWVQRGGYIEGSSIRTDLFEMPVDVVGFHLYENEEKLTWRRQIKMIRMGAQAIRNEILLRIELLLSAANSCEDADHLVGVAGLLTYASNGRFIVLGPPLGRLYVDDSGYVHLIVRLNFAGAVGDLGNVVTIRDNFAVEKS